MKAANSTACHVVNEGDMLMVNTPYMRLSRRRSSHNHRKQRLVRSK